MRHTSLHHTRGDYGYESYRARHATRSVQRWNGENIEDGPKVNIGERGTMHHEDPLGFVLAPWDQEERLLERARRRAGLEV